MVAKNTNSDSDHSSQVIIRKMKQRKTLTSIGLGLLGFIAFGSLHSIMHIPMILTLIFSYLFPLAAGLEYGWIYSLLAGATTLTTILLFIPSFAYDSMHLVIGMICLLWGLWHGYFAQKRVAHPAIWNQYLLSHWVFAALIWMLAHGLFVFLFSSNPPVWLHSLDFVLTPAIITRMTIKLSIIMYFVLILVLALLKLNFIKRILGSEKDRHADKNGLILSGAFIISIIIWSFYLIFVRLFVEDVPLSGLLSILQPHELIIGFVVLGANMLIAFVMCGYVELRSRGAEELGFSHAELIRKEAQIQRISDNFHRGMFYQILYKPEGTRQFTYVSRSVEELYGISRDEALSDSSRIYGHVHEDDIARLMNLENQAIENRTPLSATLRMKKPDGGIRWSSFVSAPTFLDDGSILWDGIEFDITEQKSIEESLRVFKESVENSADAIGMSTIEGVHYYQNSAFESMFGSIGVHPHKAYVDHRVADDVFKTIIRGERWRGEVQMYSADKSILNVLLRAYPNIDSDGRVFGLVGIHTDITDRKQAELALQKSEERLRAMVDSAPFGAHQYELRADDQLIFCGYNKSAETILGCSLDTLLGKQIEEAFPGLKGTRIPEEYKRVARTGEPFNMSQVDYESEEIRGAYEIYAFHTGINRMAVFFLDVTQRKRAEEEKEKLKLQLAQSQKLESIGQLAGGLAHDFNNILQTIIGNVDLAMSTLEPLHPVQIELKQIQQAAERSSDLTRQLLAFARKQTINPRILDLNATITNMLALLRRLIGEDIELLWKPFVGLWSVKMDSSQLDQILTNLCVNARHAIEGNGHIVMETRNVRLGTSESGSLLGSAPGDYVLLTVADNGCGMDEQTRARIFEPFFTTKSVGRGTGLGLSTVYGIVSQNNGYIDVSSEPQKGTTFRLFFPKDAGVPDLIETRRVPAVHSPHGQETILLVEDDPTILRVYKLMLEKSGYHVLASTAPEEAIQLADQYAESIDLLMTDIIMPGMNGRDLANKLLSKYPHLKRLFMSGHSAESITNSEDLEAGAQFIQKPFNKKEMATKVRAALDFGK